MVCEHPPAAFGGSPPHEGEMRAKRARGSLTHHLEFGCRPLRPGNPFAAEHSPAWEESLIAAPLVPIVVEELKIS